MAHGRDPLPTAFLLWKTRLGQIRLFIHTHLMKQAKFDAHGHYHPGTAPYVEACEQRKTHEQAHTRLMKLAITPEPTDGTKAQRPMAKTISPAGGPQLGDLKLPATNS